MRTLGFVLLAVAIAAAVGAPALAPHAGDTSFRALLNAPPTIPHLRGDDGAWHAPFIHPWTLVNQLEQRYEQDRSARVPLVWFTGGRLVGSSDDGRAPLMLLGADSFGRDVFSRLLYGARVSLGLAVAGALGALVLGAAVGALAGYAGGAADDALMRVADFVLVLPAMYVALALRSVLPLVLAPRTVFLLLAGIFAIVGAPFFARGVRAIVRSERQLDYAAAATSLGAGHARVLASASAAGRARLHGRAADDARAGVHHRRSDAVVCRAGISRSDGQLGDDAARRVERPRLRRFPVAAQPGGGDVSRRLRAESRARASRTR